MGKKKKGKKKPKAAKAAKAPQATKAETSVEKREAANVDVNKSPSRAAPPEVPTRPMTAPSTSGPGLVAQLFTTGETNPTHIWMTWLINLLAAGAWNFAFYPYINRLMQGQTTPGLKVLDTAIALVGVVLLLRVVTLLSDLNRA